MSRPTKIVVGILLLLIVVPCALNAKPDDYLASVIIGGIFFIAGIACFLTLPKKASPASFAEIYGLPSSEEETLSRKVRHGRISVIIFAQAIVILLVSLLIKKLNSGDPFFHSLHSYLVYTQIFICLCGFFVGYKNRIQPTKPGMVSPGDIGVALNGIAVIAFTLGSFGKTGMVIARLLDSVILFVTITGLWRWKKGRTQNQVDRLGN